MGLNSIMNQADALALWQKAEALAPQKKEVEALQNNFGAIEYDTLPFVRNTELTYLEKSYLHWKAFKEGKMKQTEPMMRGIMLHKAVLEPNDFYNSLAYKQDARTKIGKEANALAIAEGKMLVSEKDLDAITGITERLLSNTFVYNLFKKATHIEQPFLFRYGKHGFKIRPDVISTIETESDTVVDLKFVADANPETFVWKAQKLGYDRQLGLYQTGVQAHGLPAQNCIIIAVEKEPPYAFSIIRLTDSTLFNGRVKLDNLLTKYDKAIEMQNSNKRFLSYNNENVFEWEAEF